MVEKAADAYVETRSGMKHVIVKNLGRHTMLKPSHAATLLPDQTFKLGDRVVFVQDSGTVPIGAKGTVVGIDRLEIEVVFDDKFMSGMDLSGRCSMYRGMTVLPQSILNLSSPQCNQKTPATPAPAAAAPKPRPANIPPKNNQHNPTDDKPVGWDILGVAPVADKPKRGPHQPKSHNNSHGGSSTGGGRTLTRAPQGEQPTNVNQSLGFHARPRPPVQIAVRPNSENNKPGAEDISSLLLNLLHKNVTPDQLGRPSDLNEGQGMSFGTLPPVLPAAGSQAAALLEHLRPRPPPQQQIHQHQHQQQPAPPPAWQDAGRIQQQHGQSSPQGQRGVQRHPRPPPANGQPQAGNIHSSQRPPGFSNRGGHRGGHSQGQPRPTPANQNQNQAQTQVQGQGQSGTSNVGGNGHGKANNNSQERGNNNRRGRGRGGNRGGNKGGDPAASASAEGSASAPVPAPAATPAPAPST